MIRRTGTVRPRAAWIASAAAVVVLVSACGGGDDSTAAAGGGSGGGGAKGGDLVVGAMMAMTGPNAASGPPQEKAMLARFKAVNDAGGIEGHQIVLKVGDDQLDPAQAPGVARQLVESDNVLSIIGGGSADSFAILPYLAGKSVLAIPGGGSTALITEPKTTYRQTIPGYDLLGAATAEYAVNTLGKKRIAVAYTPDAVGEPMKAGVEKALAKMGMKPVAVVEYSAKATSAAAQAAQLKAADADFVVINHIAAVATVMIKADEQLGFKPAYGSTYALANPALPNIMGGALDGRIFFATHHPLPGSPERAEMEEQCRAVPDCVPEDANAMTGYIAADGLVEALKAAVKIAGGGVPTREQLMQATDGLKIDTKVNRGISWTKTDFTGAKQAQLIGLQGGKFVGVEPFKPLPDLG
jgi:branched-chain amino acid transport system substrate-binding protein